MAAAALLLLLQIGVALGAPGSAPAAESGDAEEPSELEIGHLVVLGRVWAFLQWHHPRFVDGSRDADDALLAVVPAVRAAADRDARNAVLVGWIDELGPVEPSGAAVPETLVHLRPDLTWMADRAELGDALVDRLAGVYAARADRTGAPIGAPVRWVKNADLTKMRPWSGEPDDGRRLLGLFRFWSVVAWLSPYRDLIDGDWDDRLEVFLPRALDATPPGHWPLAMQRLAVEVGDSHTAVFAAWPWMPPRGRCRPDVDVRFLDERTLVVWDAPVGSPLVRGDVVTHIGGTAVSELVEQGLKWTQGSNPPTRLRNLAPTIVRGDCTPAELRVQRPEEVTVTVDRVPLGYMRTRHFRDGPALQQLGDGIVYLSVEGAEEARIPEYRKALKGADGLVLDARGYPSAGLLYGLAPHLVEQTTVFATFTTVHPQNPGWTTFTDDTRLEPQRPHLDIPVVVLVDEGTQSAAEFHAMGFAAGPRTTIVGSQTAGADGNVSTFTLPGGLETMISGIGVFWPDGSPTQRVGIRRDREVRPTPEGIRANRDELLEVALEILAPELDPARREDLARRAKPSAP